MVAIFFCAALLGLFNSIDASVLVWGPRRMQIPALKQFTDSDFDDLQKQMGNPKLFVFNSPVMFDNLKNLMADKYSAYIPNTNLNVENATDLSGVETDDLIRIKSAINESDEANYLVVINRNDNRVKRELDDTTNPVLYEKDGIMIYSSDAPLLKTNSSNYYLGEAKVSTVDKRNAYSRLNVNIALEDGSKIALRFKFPLSNSGYWSLTSVEVEDTDGTTYNLTIKQDITAPKLFSYHCTGDTVFTDGKNSTELHLYDMQVQMYSKNGRFSDAYDCVNFTTGPIWSGLFVTFILALGLVFALNAIGSIKTMDKFDNQKTKQLSITVSES